MLRLDGVEAAYGPSRVLHGVTLEAREGEVVSLLGRNGAGKSTTLKSIVGLVEVTGGSIDLDGQALQGLPTHEISRLGVGWVPEDRRIFSDLTVARTLMGNPRILLLDEPSEGLAPVIVQTLAHQIAALKREGLTILLSEQNLKFAARLADRAYIIEKGQIRWEGPMSRLLEDEVTRRDRKSVV